MGHCQETLSWYFIDGGLGIEPLAFDEGKSKPLLHQTTYPNQGS